MKDSLRKQTQWVTGCGQKVSQRLVNGTGENSRTTAMQVDMMGNLFVTGTFQGETDFGG